jgi:hypothetical protein
MREASEWRSWLFVFPGTFFLGILGIFLDDEFRSVLFQVGMMLLNRFGLFFVGYFWCEDRRTGTGRDRDDVMAASPRAAIGSAQLGFRSVLKIISILSLTVLPTVVAIVFIFIDWTPWWMLLLCQISIPMYGVFEGVLYRSYIVRRGVRSRWKSLQLVSDEQFC